MKQPTDLPAGAYPRAFAHTGAGHLISGGGHQNPSLGVSLVGRPPESILITLAAAVMVGLLVGVFVGIYFVTTRPVETVVVGTGLREFPAECLNAPDFYGCLNFTGEQK